MPHKNWAVGEEVIAPDFNPMIADQIAAVFGSPGARTAGWATPPNGAVSVLSALDKTHGVEVFDGTAWRKPWNLSWGPVADPVKVIVAHNGIGATITDINGMTLTFTAVANRRYRASVQLVMQQNTVAGVATVYVRNAANVSIGGAGGTLSAGVFAGVQVFGLDVPGAGPVTYKASLNTNAGTVNATCNADQPMYLLIEDIGPAGVPS